MYLYNLQSKVTNICICWKLKMEWKWFGLFSLEKKICAISLSFVGPHGLNFSWRRNEAVIVQLFLLKGDICGRLFVTRERVQFGHEESNCCRVWTWDKKIVVERKLVGEQVWCMNCERISTCVHLSSCNKRQTWSCGRMIKCAPK